MVYELELFYDKELKNKIGETISFEPIKIGTKTEKEIYIKNKLSIPIENISISIEGEFVRLKEQISKIDSFVKITLIFEPKITTLKPINVKLNIKGDYIIK